MIGLLTVFSAGGTKYLFRQLIFYGAAAVSLAAAALVPMRLIYGLTEFTYFLSLLLLATVTFVGTGPGSKRWFELGAISLQPSEFAKVTVILMLAKYLSIRPVVRATPRLVLPLMVAVVPAVLVALEPDLSSATVFCAILAFLLYSNGMRPLYVLLLFSPIVSFVAGFSLWTWVPYFVLLALLVLWRIPILKALAALGINSLFGLLSPVVYSCLKSYQQERIRGFFAPWFDPHGLGWNAIQSQIAIGSGQLTGKGYLRGSQGRLGFLPNRHTDFAFSVIAEEFGLLGALTLLVLFAWLIHQLLGIARSSRDTYGMLLCVGIVAVIVFQVSVNIGMLLGLLPITGVTLPFISYGGSSLLATSVLVGIALNVRNRRE
ncbi:MAG: FtsW/RodA/SpoVE family cell cycle protein [candidate division WOR-3 bacterium]